MIFRKDVRVNLTNMFNNFISFVDEFIKHFFFCWHTHLKGILKFKKKKTNRMALQIMNYIFQSGQKSLIVSTKRQYQFLVKMHHLRHLKSINNQINFYFKVFKRCET